MAGIGGWSERALERYLNDYVETLPYNRIGGLGDQLAMMIPPGTVVPFAGSTVPQGYLACDGAAVSRTAYAGLFNAIGTTYGEGDGSTTFNVPNLNEEALVPAAGPEIAWVVKL